MPNPKILCIYHGNCADGFGAAWVVRKRFGDDVEFHAGVYQAPPPDVCGRDVIIVDFSYKRDVLLEMAKSAHSVLVLDHHKSAQEDLGDLPPPIVPNSWEAHRADSRGTLNDGVDPSLPRVVFDMERSGAGLAWRFFFPDDPMPRLIEHIQDRDLWKFKLEGTREIQAALFSYPYDFAVWDRLMAETDRLRQEGAAIERKHHKDIAEFIKAAAFRCNIAGYDVPVLNAPYFFSSDAGNIMAQGEPFAACYWDTAKGRVYSLRSAEDGVDVSEIAKKFGGGGHKHAAGFSISSKPGAQSLLPCSMDDAEDRAAINEALEQLSDCDSWFIASAKGGLPRLIGNMNETATLLLIFTFLSKYADWKSELKQLLSQDEE